MVKGCQNLSSDSQQSEHAQITDVAAKRKPHYNYQFIDKTKRIEVIYDNFVHD